MFGLYKNLFDSLFSQDAFFGFPERIVDSEGVLRMTVDMPGVKEEDIDIQLKDRKILISGNRKTATSSYMIRQEAYLGEDYDLDNINATLKDGVLTLAIHPKQLPDKSEEIKKIPISTKT